MTNGFGDCVEIILREEGGFVDHPADPGGATNFGITFKTLTLARGQKITREDVRFLTRNEAIEIYHALYWCPLHGDDLPSGVDLILFDMAVTSGVRRAMTLMQSIIGVEADGLWGPKTAAALSDFSIKDLIDIFSDHRRAYCHALPTFPVFGVGWTGRIERIRLSAHRRALSQPPMKPKETLMDNTQPFYLSRTIWSNFVGLLSFALTITGHNSFDANGFTDALLQLATAGSFVASTLFRVLATKSISS